MCLCVCACEGVEGHITLTQLQFVFAFDLLFFFVAFCLPFNLLAGLKMHLPRLLLLIRHVLRTHLLFMKTVRRSGRSFRLTLRFVGVNSMRVVIKNYVKMRPNAATCTVNPTGLELMATINN